MCTIFARYFYSLQLPEQPQFMIKDLAQTEVHFGVKLNDDLPFAINVNEV